MNLIIKIAWRNLLRHKGKSLVIGLILLFGSLIMTLGNGVISGMDKGISENIINRFIGHIVLVSTNQKIDNALLTPGGKGVEPISGYTNIKKVIDQESYIDKYLPMGRGVALVLSEETEPAFTMLFGVQFEDYQKMFNNNVQMVEGRELKNNERGALVTTTSREELYSYTSYWMIPENTSLIRTNLSAEAKSNLSGLIIKQDVVLMGFGTDDSTMDIRIPVKGIYKYKALNKIWSFCNIIDIESFRECFSLITASDAETRVPETKKGYYPWRIITWIICSTVISPLMSRPARKNMTSLPCGTRPGKKQKK